MDASEVDWMLIHYPQLLGGPPNDTIQRALYCHYAKLKFRQYQEQPDPKHLEDAIQKQEAATVATPVEESEKAGRHDFLGMMYQILYTATGQERYLDSAVLHAEHATNRIAEDDHSRLLVADRLGAWLTDRYMLNQQVEDLDNAITATYPLLEYTAEDQIQHGPPIFHLAHRFKLRYEHRGSADDLQAAMHYTLRALRVCIHSPEYVQEILQKLCGLVNLAIERVGTNKQLEAASEILKAHMPGPLQINSELAATFKILQGILRGWRQTADSAVADDVGTAFGTHQSTRLCNLCQRISFRSFYGFCESEREQTLPWQVTPDFLFYKHHRSFEALKASAGNGCWFCAHIAFALDNYDFSRDAHPTTLNGIWFSLNPAEARIDGMPQSFLVSYGSQYTYALMREFETMTEQLWYPPIDRCNDLDTGSNMNIELARRWFMRCQGTHLRCAVSTSTELPTRVVDIGSQGDRTLRLVTGGLNDEPYAALSHCWGEWGELHALKLTTENLGSLQQGFGIEELPLSWQQAVLTTRKLGIQYLWIDSLCIKQRDHEDWETESKKMGQYYSRATITIAAFSAVNGSFPIFNKRDPVTVKPCKLTFREPRRGKKYTAYVHVQSFEQGISDVQRYNMAPLEQRAWCFQEMILSPRVLRFGLNQISWACHEYEASELRPQPLSRMDRFGMMQLLLMTTVFEGNIFKSCEHEPNEECNAHASATDAFYNLVQTYSLLKLTRESDRLPALSGIAQQIHERIGGEYLAGLWSSGLCEGLLWRAIDNMPKQPQFPLRIKTTSRSRPQVPSAPSWSWASVELDSAEISFLHQGDRKWPEHTLLPDSLQAEVEPNQLNPYGQVTRGTLTIKGKLLPATARPCEIGSRDYFYSLNLLDDVSGEVVGRADFDETVWPRGRFWCAPIVYITELDVTFGLLLALDVQQRYTRIGRFNVKRRELFDKCESRTVMVI